MTGTHQAICCPSQGFISFLGSLKFPVTSQEKGFLCLYGLVARVTLEKVTVGRREPRGIYVT